MHPGPPPLADVADLVPAALRAPEAVASWPAERLSRLVRQARAAGLLGRLSAAVAAAAPHDSEAAGHVAAAVRVTRAQQREIRREVDFIARALQPLGEPVVLLKGAAYVMAGLPAAEGRVFSDVDILLPRARLAEAESLLMLAGWMGTHEHPYDQRFYREWMHELPPMEHVHRRTTLDVHHSIAPLTGRLRPDAAALLAAAVPVPGHAVVRVLCPADMLLHSITHLFTNDELSHSLRDLSDIDLLCRHFATDASFWPSLESRAGLHGLGRLLYYALTHAQRVLGTPVPPEVVQRLQAVAPAWPAAPLMTRLWQASLTSPHPSARPPTFAIARFALYLRGHWLRMPLPMLLRHLATKTLRKREDG